MLCVTLDGQMVVMGFCGEGREGKVGIARLKRLERP